MVVVDFCSKKGINLFVMNYRNPRFISERVQPPAGASIWLLGAGHLFGNGGTRFVFSPVHRVGPHLILSGSGTVRCFGQEHRLSAGHMFWLLPGFHYEYFEDPDNPWQYVWLHLEGEGAVDFAAGCGFGENAAVRAMGNADELAQVMFGLRDALAPPEANPYQVIAMLFDFARACGGSPDVGDDVEDAYGVLVKRACMTIDSNLHVPLNVTELAKVLQVGRTKLFLAFREKLGVTPVVYLRQKRVERVKELLQSSDRTLEDIAYATGFANAKYLMKTFREVEGMTAGDWRKRN